jgi:hypothetical protein
MSNLRILPTDVAVLRELAKCVREACESTENRERVRLFYQHDAGPADRPIVLTETDGGIEMVMPDYTPRCSEPWARGWERYLREMLMHHEIIRDDYPLEPWINVGWQISMSDVGVQSRNTNPDVEPGQRGAYHIEKAIEDLERDFHLLHPRTFSVDKDASLEQKAMLEEVFDGVLGVRMRGNPWWTMGLTQKAVYLIGLENLMMYMFDQPEALHRLMAFLRDDNLALLDWMTDEGILNLNNENDYIGSGSRGYTHALPGSARELGAPARTQDMWALIESQETVGVGPRQYEEFIFPYENAIAQRFGGVYYGCCEPVHTRWEVLKNLANLRRVSVSPWCDEDFMGEALADKLVYSRKPNPTLVSTDLFDEDLIRADLRKTLSVTSKNNCSTEIIMKDVHTLKGEPDRLTRWTALAREVIGEYY